ncbi:MAG: phosphoribosyltransferase [Candidatus Cybelea sp.]
MQIFADRADAGRQLAERLVDYADNPQAVVLALPRGGVPVGYEVAHRLHVPLDLYVVRKLGVPGHEELAMGALASDGTCVVDEELIAALGVEEAALEEVVRREIVELRRRESAYRDSPHPDLAGKIAIVVDDGLATGATMRAAATSLRERRPAAIVAGVPVAAPRTCANLRSVVDRVVCVATPEPFHAVGLYYKNFEQTSDDDVRRLLAAAAAELTGRRISA